MKVVLVSLNIWELNFRPVTLPCLKLFAKKDPLINRSTEIVIKNYAVNDPKTLEDLYLEHPDVVGFSCYIWNFERTLEIAHCIKQVLPRCVVVLGGPEVSYTPEEVMTQSQAVDFVVRGEGEIPFSKLLQALLADDDHRGFSKVSGISFRDGERIETTAPGELVSDLSEIPSPYLSGEIRLSRGEDVMLEGSRGCPYKCNFCDFGKNNPLTRYFPIERVKQELTYAVKSGTHVIGFTDAVFNMHRGRLKEIFTLLAGMKDRYPYRLFLEIYADLLSDEDIELLRDLGPVRMEVGLQTISAGAVKDMNRRQNLNKFRKNIRQLEKLDNCHVSIDLIYGLPGDTYTSFKDSIDFAFSFVESQVRVYGLSILKGTDYYNHLDAYGLKYESTPPYRVISNYSFSYDDMVKARKIGNLVRYFTYHEEMVNLSQVVHHLCRGLDLKPSELIEEFADWLERRGMGRNNLSADSITSTLEDFVGHLCEIKNKGSVSIVFREFVRYMCYLKQVTHSPPPPESRVTVASAPLGRLKPRLNPQGLLRSFSLDPVTLMKIPGDRLEDVKPQSTSVFFVYENSKVSTFRLSEPATAILGQCDGERTIDDIVRAYLDERVARNQHGKVRARIETAFATFFEQKFVAV